MYFVYLTFIASLLYLFSPLLLFVCDSWHWCLLGARPWVSGKLQVKGLIVIHYSEKKTKLKLTRQIIFQMIKFKLGRYELFNLILTFVLTVKSKLYLGCVCSEMPAGNL